MAKRPCLDCGTPSDGARCPAHRKQRDRHLWANGKGQRYDTVHRKYSREVIAAHRALHGDVCPGWKRDAHTIEPSEWVRDHDVGPLCRSCNAVKAATYDKQVARQAGGDGGTHPTG